MNDDLCVGKFQGDEMSNMSLGKEEIENRVGFHKAIAELAPLVSEN